MDGMSAMLFRNLVVPTGPSCRRCAQPIARSDGFGMSERICASCRGQIRSSKRRIG